ncbi:MAG: uroporphyrinogen decarboxylase family protein [Anaerofustis sp.]
MNRVPYDPAKEHEIIGMYPPVESVEIAGMPCIPPMPKFYRPIERTKNFEMFLNKEIPYWMPISGWFGPIDFDQFRPRQHPDNYANHQCFDGGGVINFKEVGNIQVGWFELELQWEGNAGGATAKPGVTKVPDITKWEDYVSMPNLDELDWDGIKKENVDYLANDRVHQLGIQLGMWERLMCLMGVSEAAIALVDEDQQEGVHRFFDRLSDVYVDYIQRMKKLLTNLTCVYFHDDWGTSTGPFFSLETCREMLVPYIKKVTDACHELGITFEHHCCGNAQKLIPAMIEQGDDFWTPQLSLNDVDKMLEMLEGSSMTLAVPNTALTADMDDAQIHALAKVWWEKYHDKWVLLGMNIDSTGGNDPSKYGIFADAIYELSRIEYNQKAGN